MEVVIFPEMITAGVEAYRESLDRKLSEEDIAIAVYAAMQAVLAISCIEQVTVH